MNIFGKIFGSPKIIDAGIAGIDALVFTDEEKSNQKLKFLKAYEPFKIAQRYLAFAFTGLFIVTYLPCLVMAFLGVDYSPITKVASEFRIPEIEMVIMCFYFVGGAVSGGFRSK